MIKKTKTCLLSSVHRRTDILDFNYFTGTLITTSTFGVCCGSFSFGAGWVISPKTCCSRVPQRLRGVLAPVTCYHTFHLLPKNRAWTKNPLLLVQASTDWTTTTPLVLKKGSNGDAKAPPFSLWVTVTTAPWKESVRVHHRNTPNQYNEALHMVGWRKGALHSVRKEHAITIIHICI